MKRHEEIEREREREEGTRIVFWFTLGFSSKLNDWLTTRSERERELKGEN